MQSLFGESCTLQARCFQICLLKQENLKTISIAQIHMKRRLRFSPVSLRGFLRRDKRALESDTSSKSSGAYRRLRNLVEETSIVQQNSDPCSDSTYKLLNEVQKNGLSLQSNDVAPTNDDIFRTKTVGDNNYEIEDRMNSSSCSQNISIGELSDKTTRSKSFESLKKENSFFSDRGLEDERSQFCSYDSEKRLRYDQTSRLSSRCLLEDMISLPVEKTGISQMEVSESEHAGYRNKMSGLNEREETIQRQSTLRTYRNNTSIKHGLNYENVHNRYKTLQSTQSPETEILRTDFSSHKAKKLCVSIPKNKHIHQQAQLSGIWVAEPTTKLTITAKTRATAILCNINPEFESQAWNWIKTAEADSVLIKQPKDIVEGVASLLAQSKWALQVDQFDNTYLSRSFPITDYDRQIPLLFSIFRRASQNFKIKPIINFEIIQTTILLQTFKDQPPFIRSNSRVPLDDHEVIQFAATKQDFDCAMFIQQEYEKLS
ncbi:uncharacterized protein V1516DRAFT_691483 [Lipomyces oligophaga]|uniref:uncharacterized protein n=1 Tax=Lipomyces oligophaga TaxID=45792 RepID=UPI0034CD1546